MDKLKNGNPFPKKHRKALEEMYTKHGVGKSPKQRHVFWNAKHPYTNITHVDPTDDVMRVKVFEYSHLIDLFPEDHTIC